MKRTMFQPLDKRRYFEQIAEMIREKIFQEDLQAGFKLPSEQQLASELNVSRSVVREALRILDVMGYVQIRKGPHGGIFVSSLIHKPLSDSLRNLATNGQITVDHLFDVRLQVEPFIIEEATKHATDKDIEELLNLKKEGEKNAGKPARVKEVNMRFHSLLAEITGNPVWSILMTSLIEILIELNYSFLDPPFEKELFKVHSNIIDAMAERRIEDVGRLVKEDILFVKENLKRFVEEGAATPGAANKIL